jgi:hypothetical protein
VTLLELLQDVAARLAWIREEYEPRLREQALEELEEVVACWLAAYERQAA